MREGIPWELNSRSGTVPFGTGRTHARDYGPSDGVRQIRLIHHVAHGTLLTVATGEFVPVVIPWPSIRAFLIYRAIEPLHLRPVVLADSP